MAILNTGSGLETDAILSDLFFNLDHDDAKTYAYDGTGRKCFDDWDKSKMHAQALWFSECVRKLTGTHLSPAAILEDFYGRV